MTSRRKNVRDLDTIADDIHKLERANIFDVGDLLIEAKAQCAHGQWLEWIWSNFEYAESTAQRYMSAATLAGKCRMVRDLKIGASTIYALTGEDEADLPAIVKELAKHANKARLAPRDAERVIKIGIGRQRFGDHPDATLLALLELSDIVGEPWHEKVVAALQEIQPDADEAALAIINEVVAKHEAEEADFEGDEFEDEAEQEANAILEGPPPDLPPPVTPPEPLKLGTNTVWAETDPFSRAVTDLLELRTKPIARFVGVVSPTELREVADFLLAVAAAAEKAKAA
jgi:hypothetical protein